MTSPLAAIGTRTVLPASFVNNGGEGDEGTKSGPRLNVAFKGGPAPARGLMNFIGGGTSSVKSLTISCLT